MERLILRTPGLRKLSLTKKTILPISVLFTITLTFSNFSSRKYLTFNLISVKNTCVEKRQWLFKRAQVFLYCCHTHFVIVGG